MGIKDSFRGTIETACPECDWWGVVGALERHIITHMSFWERVVYWWKNI